MKEKRIINSTFEVRADGEKGKTLAGIAAVVNSPTIMFTSEWNGKKEIYKEVISAGAFDGVIGDDVRALVDHESAKVLGRTTAGTLKVFINERGDLAYEVPDMPNTTYANDLMESVKRGDITQSSFGFEVEEDLRSMIETETEVTYTRDIKKLRHLYDVSPVTFPAYEDTVTEMRKQTDELFKEIREAAKQPEKQTGTPNLTACELKTKINNIKNSL